MTASRLRGKVTVAKPALVVMAVGNNVGDVWAGDLLLARQLFRGSLCWVDEADPRNRWECTAVWVRYTPEEQVYLYCGGTVLGGAVLLP